MAQPARGGYGVVEPIEAASTADPGGSGVPFAFGVKKSSVTATKGWGFVGPYAKEWLEKYPTTDTRNTYLG